MKNCTLIGDRGYLSTQVQTDLFNYSNIKLDTPMKATKKLSKAEIYFFRKSRKRIKRYFLNFVTNLKSEIIMQNHLMVSKPES